MVVEIVLSLLVAIATVLVCFLTLLVAILAFISGSIVYTNWETARKYEKKVAKLLESQKVSIIDCYLAQLLLYSQQTKRMANMTDVNTFTADARDALRKVFEVLQELEKDNLKLGKKGSEVLRKEVQNVKFNFQNVDVRFKKSLEDLIEKCNDIIELLDRLSFD